MGYIEFNELTQAFQQMGYRFTPPVVQNLLAKYDSRTRRLTLDNFMVACVQIKRLADGFRSRDRQMQGTATIQYEDCIGHGSSPINIYTTIQLHAFLFYYYIKSIIIHMTKPLLLIILFFAMFQ